MDKLWESNDGYDDSKPQSSANMPYNRLYQCLTPEQLSELLHDAERLGWGLLNLSNTQIRELPDFIGNLTCLKELDLNETQISTLPDFIGKLTSLQKLNLSNTQIRKLPDSIGNLTCLKELDLNETQISTLPDSIGNLTSLQKLNLSNTQICELPDSITRLLSLQSLCLRDCHLKEIPYSLVKLGLPFIIDDYHFTGQGINLTGVTLDEGDLQLFAQPRDVIEAAYLTQVQVRECKVIFLGDGGVGKSSLIERMVNGSFAPGSLPTDGVKMTKWHTLTEDKPYTLRFLDFGGQEIMFSMHRCFLTAHTVYVVVCESRDDMGIDNEAVRWLETVKAFAPDCPVILVLNKCDLNANVSVNERDLKERNPKLKCVLKTSAKNNPDSRYGVNHLINAILNEVPCTVNDYKMNADMLGVKLALEETEYYYISSEDYRRICQMYNIMDKKLQYALLGYFRDLGVVYYYESNVFDTRLESVRVLNPEWLTNGIYRLILRTRENGFLPHAEIKETLRATHAGDVLPGITYTAVETEYILHVMRYFEISHDMGDGVEMIPLKMPKTPPPTVDNFNKHNALHLRWEGAYLPNNLIHRLLIRKFPELDKNCVWRTGGHFVQEGGGCEALVEMNEKALNIYVNGERDCRPYLETFRRVIQAILTNLNLKTLEVICCTVDGQEGSVPYEDVVQQYYYKRESIYIPGIRKFVNPATLLKGIYFDWEKEAEAYRKRTDTLPHEERTRAEVEQIRSESELMRMEAEKVKTEIRKNRAQSFFYIALAALTAVTAFSVLLLLVTGRIMSESILQFLGELIGILP